MHRCSFQAVVSFTLLVLALIAGPATAAEKLRIGKAVPFAWTFSVLEVGIEAGHFARQGLELEVTGFGGDAKLQQALAANGVDLGLGSGPGMAFATKGAPVKGVAAMAGLPRSIGIVVAYGSPHKSIADLKGRKVGVTTVGSLTEWLAKRMAVLQGWGPNGVTIVTVGAMETTRAVLKTGEIDAVMLAIEAAYPFEDVKEMRVLGTTAGFIDAFITHVIFARNDLIAKKPQLVRAFLQGWFATIADIRFDKDKAVTITARALNAAPSVIARTYDEEISMFSAVGTFEPKALAVLKQSFVEMGLLKEIPDDKAMFTTEFVPVRAGN